MWRHSDQSRVPTHKKYKKVTDHLLHNSLLLVPLIVKHTCCLFNSSLLIETRFPWWLKPFFFWLENHRFTHKKRVWEHLIVIQTVLSALPAQLSQWQSVSPADDDITDLSLCQRPTNIINCNFTFDFNLMFFREDWNNCGSDRGVAAAHVSPAALFHRHLGNQTLNSCWNEQQLCLRRQSNHTSSCLPSFSPAVRRPWGVGWRWTSFSAASPFNLFRFIQYV